MATSSGRTTPLIFVAGVCTVLLLSTLTAHAVPVVTPRARLLTSADTRATPTVFLTPSTSSSSSTPFSREMSIVTGAPFTIEVVVRASSQVPVAMPGSATNAAGHTVMAPESSPYVEPDMKPVEDVTVVVAVPSGIMAIGDVVLQQVSAGTGAVVDMTAAQATVAVQYSQPRTRPGLYLDDQLFPDIANVSSTVDVVSFSLLSLPPAAAVKLSLRSSIATGSVQVGALPPYAVGSSFAVTNTSSPEQQRTYVQADVRRLEVTCDAVASCNSAGSCLSTGACSCVATWGDTGCSTALVACDGATDDWIVVSEDLPGWSSPQQWFAHLVVATVVFVVVVRVMLFCSTQWGARALAAPAVPQLQRNWRNGIVVAGLACDTVLSAAPVFQAHTRWSFLVPVKVVSRLVMAKAVHAWWPTMLSVFAAVTLSICTLLAARFTKRGDKGSTTKRKSMRASATVGESSRLSLDSLNASLSMPALLATSGRRAPRVETGTGAVSMRGTAAPAGQTRGCTAVAIYLVSRVLFLPMLASMVQVWSCGFPFRPYANNGHPSESCPIDQECWSTPHVIMCGLSAVGIAALLAVATVTFAHVQRVDSPTGTSWSGLPKAKRLEALCTNRFILTAVVGKVFMVLVGALWPSTHFVIRESDVSVVSVAAFGTNMGMFFVVCVSAPFNLQRLNQIARYAYGLSTWACFIVLGARVYDADLVAQPSLAADFDLVTNLEFAALVPALAWGVPAGCLLLVDALLGRRGVRKSLWKPKRAPGVVRGSMGLGGTDSWTDSFRVVADTNWSGSLGTTSNRSRPQASPPIPRGHDKGGGDHDAKAAPSTPWKRPHGSTSGGDSSVPHSASSIPASLPGSLPSAAAFGDGELLLESLMLSDDSVPGTAAGASKRLTSAGPSR